MEGMPDNFSQQQDRKEEYFDANGSPRLFRELPDGTVFLLSNEEFAEEMDNRGSETQERWPKERTTPKGMKGKRDLGSFTESGKYKEPKHRSLLG